MSRRLIPRQPNCAFHPEASKLQDLMRYYPMFPWAIPHPGIDHLRVTHPFATLPLTEVRVPVRLACLKRAASVRSEPGSNSPSYVTVGPKTDSSIDRSHTLLDPSPLPCHFKELVRPVGERHALDARRSRGRSRLIQPPLWKVKRAVGCRLHLSTVSKTPGHNANPR